MLETGPSDSSRQGRLAAGFVGRGPELEEILACVEEVRAGRPWVVLVEGGAGIGKTALTSRVVEGLDGFAVLRAYCVREETDLTFGMIDQLRTRVPAWMQAELAGLLSRTPEPAEVGAALLQVVSRMQASGSVAIVIEDLQWSDQASAQALGFIQRRLQADQVVTFLTARTHADGVEGAGVITAAETHPGWSWLVAREHLLRIALRGLDRGEVVDLARVVGITLNGGDAQRLQLHTRGNPLYLHTLLTGASQDTFTSGGPLPVPVSLSAAVDRQLTALDASARAMLEALAVLDLRSPLATVAELADIGEPTRALDPLVASGLIRWYPSDPLAPLEITHPLQRDAVYAAITPPRRRELHAKAAGAVARSASWAHRVAAADRADPVLAGELEAEARDLIGRAQSDRAATLLLWAADLNEQREHVERLTIAAAATLFLNNHQRRFHSLRARIEGFPASVGRTMVLGFSALSRGEIKSALQTLYQTLEAATAPGVPPAVAELAGPTAGTIASGLYWLATDLEECCRMCEVAAALGASDLQITVRAARTLAFATLKKDGSRAALDLFTGDRQLLPVRSSEVSGTDAALLAMRGYCHVMAGQLSAGLDDLEHAFGLASASPVRYVDLDALYFLAQGHYLAGHWDDAKLHGERAAAVALTEQVGWGNAQSHGIWAMAAAGLGEWDTAEEAAKASRLWFDKVGPPTMEVFPCTAAAAVAAAKGDQAEVLTALEPMWSMRHVAHARSWLIHWGPLLAEAQISVGDLDPAAETMAWITNLATDVALLRPAVQWLAGRLAEARGDAAAADRAYAAGLAIPPTSDDAPYYRARLEHAYARLLTTTGNPKTATQLLRCAHQRLSAMGARPYLQLVNNDLADLQIPHADTDTLAPLTDRERDVARLVADGLTNADVAAHLYLSSKTVEYHLARIYPKLGITSRRQLRDLIPAGH